MRIRAGVLLAGWIVVGAGLGCLAVSAWLYAAQVQAWIAEVQKSYAAGPDPAWIQRADAHVHITVSCLATLWFGVGCRLFAPRTLPWLPIALTILLAMSDELCQLGAVWRTFEWSDQLGDVVGMVLAFPLLLLLRRVEVSRVANADRR